MTPPTVNVDIAAVWPDTSHESTPRDHLYRSATWLLGRHPRLARLANRVTGVIDTSELGGDGEPFLDLDHLADVVNAATRYAAAWGDYQNQYRPAQEETAYEQWRQAGPNLDDLALGLADFLVMSSGEIASLRLLATFATDPVPFKVDYLSSLDAEGQRLLADWTTACEPPEPMTTPTEPVSPPTLGGAELSGAAAEQVTARIFSAEFERFTDQQAACGYCARPVRLRGTATTLDTATGEVLSRYDTAREPDGVTYSAAATGVRQSVRPARGSTRATCGTCSPQAPAAG